MVGGGRGTTDESDVKRDNGIGGGDGGSNGGSDSGSNGGSDGGMIVVAKGEWLWFPIVTEAIVPLLFFSLRRDSVTCSCTSLFPPSIYPLLLPWPPPPIPLHTFAINVKNISVPRTQKYTYIVYV